MADTFPETTVPIMMPMTSVSEISAAAMSLRRRVQSPEFVAWSICFLLLSMSVARSTCGKYNTRDEG